MYSIKFDGHKQAQAQELHGDDGTIVLQSYNTMVAKINPKGWLTCYGLYSATTIKHIGWFMRKNGSSYQIAKQCYHDKKQFNLRTRKFRDRVWD